MRYASSVAKSPKLTVPIDRLADHPINRIDELLPRNVVPLLPATARTTPVH